MYEMMERSVVVSSRMDARALAVVARWLAEQDRAMLRSKSKVVSVTVKMMAEIVIEQQPQLAIESVEEAYIWLARLGLAPASQASNRAISRAMGVEQQLAGSDGQMADLGMVHKKVTRMFAGQGFAGAELQDKVNNEMAGMVGSSRQLATPAQATAEISSEEQMEIELRDQALKVFQAQGASEEQLEEAKKSWQAAQDKKRAKKKAEQQAQIEQWKAQQSKKEKQKLTEMKQALSQPPQASDSLQAS